MIDPIVELRWLRSAGGPKHKQGQVLGRPIKGQSNDYCSRMTLQYRTDQTDWQDVPIVDAE